VRLVGDLMALESSLLFWMTFKRANKVYIGKFARMKELKGSLEIFYKHLNSVKSIKKLFVTFFSNKIIMIFQLGKKERKRNFLIFMERGRLKTLPR